MFPFGVDIMQIKFDYYVVMSNYRKKLSRGRSARVFRRGKRVHKRNRLTMRSLLMRGGYRI